MNKVLLFSVFIYFLPVRPLHSQEARMYRLHLKDKGNTTFSLSKPEDFLSEKSIQRRIRQNLPVDSVDLPLDPNYLNAIAETGATVRTYSKWVKTVVVQLSDSDVLSRLGKLPFVDSLYCVWSGALPVESESEDDMPLARNSEQNTLNSYGYGFAQIALNNGHLLHQAGFRGKGMTIAVLDGSFTNADNVDFFNREQIKEVKSFSHDTTDPLREGSDHGTRVLSCMLSNKSGEFVGTAPEADYYLLRTEVADEEYPVEEDYWVAALEYADSAGVDVVTGSLGYSTFYDSNMNHTQSQLDGNSIPISRAANLAASRGLLLFVSAGNDGDKSWGKINFPADAENIITVGSVSDDSIRSAFSSHGYTADNRIKPDLMAQGFEACVVGSSGEISYANGTSFSTPIMAGLAACLWEALPDLDSFAMLRLLRETANRFQNPDSLMGYGIADVFKAYLQQKTDIQPIFASADLVYISVNHSDNRLYINFMDMKEFDNCRLDIYSALGNRISSVSCLSAPIDISSLPKGIYIISLKNGFKQWVQKFVND